jgi:cytochrome c oxidase cbb3-type subunit I/II
MLAPDAVSSGSIMPAYPWLFEQTIDKQATAAKIRALRKVGVPYEPDYENRALEDLERQANRIAENLQLEGINVQPDAEIIALIAYLQRLGKDVKAAKTAEAQTTNP